MGVNREPFSDPFNLRESRNERRARQARRRRRAAAGSLIALVVLAAVGYGVYALATRGGTSDASTAAISPAAGDESSSSEAPDTAKPPSSTLPNLAPQRLEISADPEAVNLTITLQDGSTLSGKTPFAEEVLGGNTVIELSKKGYNSATRHLVLDRPSAVKVWLDPAGQIVESLLRFKCGRGPQQLAFSPDGTELWVSLLGGFGIEVYSPVTGAKTGEVDLGSEGTAELLFSADGGTLFAVNMKTNLVYEIDPTSRRVKRQLDTEGTSPKVLALSPNGKTLWTANWGSNNVSEIDVATGTLVRKIPTVKTPRGLYVTRDGKRLYVAGCANGELQRIDLATGEGTLVFRSGGALWHMAADDSLGLLYVDDNRLGKVYIVDLTTETTSTLAATGNRPNTIALNADGKVLFVSNRGKDDPKNAAHAGPEWGSVLLFDTRSGFVLDTIVGGNQCTGLAISSDGHLLAFSDFYDDRIRVYRVPAYEELVAGRGGRAPERFADVLKD